MAIARMTKEASAVKAVNVPSSVKELQIYLGRLKGKKILTFEETSMVYGKVSQGKSFLLSHF